MLEIYLSDLKFRDWRDLRRLATHPDFFYRALNDRNAWIAWRAGCYIFKARLNYLFKRNVKAIRDRASNNFLGCVILADLSKKCRGHAEIGYFVAVPYRGKGVGTNAVLRFVDWAIQNYDLQSIEATVHPHNLPSLKILGNIGLKEIRHVFADERKYFGRDDTPEPRLIMNGNVLTIKSALNAAKQRGFYSPSISVL